MIIRKKRILSIGRNIRGVKRGSVITVAINDIARFNDELIEIGFSSDQEVGEIILPGQVGPVSKFNCEGKYLVHRDKPMETAYRQAEWTWQEFRGRYDTVEQSKIVEIPYKRYPRTFISPPSVELGIKKLPSGGKVLVSPPIEFSKPFDDYLIHTINLFLEIFGECELLKEDLSSHSDTKLIRLNWEVLPKGQLPWQQLHKHLQKILNRQPEGNRIVIDKRYEAINAYKPEFVAVGQGGFDGYVIFGFPSRSLFILESTQVNNATYVLDRNWEELSSLTKAELLNNKLHKDRLIHRENWFTALNRVFF